MTGKRGSIVVNLGWGLVADVLLLVTALLIMSIFAFSSFSSAYLIGLLILVMVAVSYLFYSRTRKRGGE